MLTEEQWRGKWWQPAEAGVCKTSIGLPKGRWKVWHGKAARRCVRPHKAAPMERQKLPQVCEKPQLEGETASWPWEHYNRRWARGPRLCQQGLTTQGRGWKGDDSPQKTMTESTITLRGGWDYSSRLMMTGSTITQVGLTDRQCLTQEELNASLIPIFQGRWQCL